MNTQVHYGNFGKSEELDKLISIQVRKIDKLVDERAKAKIWVSNDTNIEGRGVSQYSTQIELIRPHGKDYFIKKSEKDFFSSLQKAFGSLKNLLRRE